MCLLSPFFYFFMCGVCSLPSFVIPLMNDPVFQACTSPGRQGHTHHTLHTRLVCCVLLSCLDSSYLVLFSILLSQLVSCGRVFSCLRLSWLVFSCLVLSCLVYVCLYWSNLLISLQPSLTIPQAVSC